MIEFHLLGSLDLRRRDGEELSSLLTQPKQTAILAHLSVALPRGFQRRDKLAYWFWPEADQVRARASLRKAIHLLRRALGEDVVLNRGAEEIGLDWQRFWCDTLAFQDALAGEDLEGALALYRGDLLEGFFLSSCPDFERWLETERERLRELAAGAAWELAHHHLRQGRVTSAERLGQRALCHVCTDENETRRFIRALSEAGDRAAAVRFYERFVLHLRETLALGPSTETVALVREIRGSAPGAPSPLAGGRASPEAHVAGPDSRPAEVPSEAPSTRLPAGRGATDRRHTTDGLPTGRPGFGALRRRLRWLVPLAAVPLLFLAGLRLFFDSEPPLLGRDARIAVLLPVNHTGDPDLDWLSAAVVGAVVEALDLAEIGRPVTPEELVFAVDGNPASPEAKQLLLAEWPERTNAALALTGGYYLEGDSVLIRLMLEDTQDNVRPVPPVVTHRDEMRVGLSELQLRAVSRVAGVLAPDDFQWSWEDRKELPQDLHSYEDLFHAVFVYGTEGPWAAIPLFTAVAAGDPEYTAPVSWLIGIYWGNGMPAQADSLCTGLEPRMHGLSPWSRLAIGMNCDAARGDHREALAKAKLLVDYSSIYQCRVGFHAMDLNRPREAAEGFERYDPSASGFAAAYSDRVRREQALAYHWLGDFKKELDTVRNARELFPQDLLLIRAEIRALIALYREDEIPPLLEDGLHLLGRNSRPRSFLHWTAAELDEHGHPESAKKLWGQLLAWYDGRPPEDRQTPALARERAETLLHLGQTTQALPTLTHLVNENGDNCGDLGRLGVALARLGRTSQVEGILDQLEEWDDPYALGTNRFWQAAIAAAADDADRSIGFLDRAVAEGMAFRDLAPRESPFLKPLRGQPSFEKFLRPKG